MASGWGAMGGKAVVPPPSKCPLVAAQGIQLLQCSSPLSPVLCCRHSPLKAPLQCSLKYYFDNRLHAGGAWGAPTTTSAVHDPDLDSDDGAPQQPKPSNQAGMAPLYSEQPVAPSNNGYAGAFQPSTSFAPAAPVASGSGDQPACTLYLRPDGRAQSQRAFISADRECMVYWIDGREARGGVVSRVGCRPSRTSCTADVYQALHAKCQPAGACCAWPSWGSQHHDALNCAHTRAATQASRAAALSKREKELEAKELRLKELEDELRVAGGFQKKNWPICWPILYHDIAGEIPEQSRRVVREMGCSSAFGTTSSVALLYWESRLMNRCQAAFPFSAEKWSFAGWMTAIAAFDWGDFPGVVYIIGACFWTIEAVYSLWCLKDSYLFFRGRGGVEQVKADEAVAQFQQQQQQQHMGGNNQV
eukprot:352598-Chlamydomonas_euryale.AAC.28